MEVTTNKLMHDLKTVVGDTEALLKATADQGGEQLARARARAEESLRGARSSLQQTGKQVNEQVHQHPWTAVGIAAGIGLMLGILLTRK